MGKIASRQIRLFRNSGDGDLLSGGAFNPKLRGPCRERRNANRRGDHTHGCKNLEEKKNEVAGGENQEIHGGVLADLDEETRRTTNSGKTSIVTFCGIYDNKQRQGVFDAEDIGYRG